MPSWIMDNDISKSLLELISTGVNSRKSGQPVRFVFDNSIAKDLLDSIIMKLGLDVESALIPGGRYHNFKDFMQFPNVGGPELVYSKDAPLTAPAGQDAVEYPRCHREKGLHAACPVS